MSENEEKSAADKSLEQMRGFINKSNDMGLKFFCKNYLFPHLETLRDEYLGGLEYLEEEMGGDGEDEGGVGADEVRAFTKMAKDLVATLDGAAALGFRAAGWIDGTSPTASMPAEVATAYAVAAQALPAFLQAAQELEQAAEEAEEEDAEDDDEDEGEPKAGPVIATAATGTPSGGAQ